MSATSASEFSGDGPPVGRRKTVDDGANLPKCTISRDASQENDSKKQKLHCLRLYQGRQDRTYGKHVAILPVEQRRTKNVSAEQTLQNMLDAKSRNAAWESQAMLDMARRAQPVNKKPIKFKDAVGRKFSFPFELCCTWQGMEDLIKQAFLHIEVIGPHVNEGHYDLVGPNGNIILPQIWESVIEPDWLITMHMWPIPEREKAPKPPPDDESGNPEGTVPSKYRAVSSDERERKFRALKKPVVKEMPSLNSRVNGKTKARKTNEETENPPKKRPRTNSPKGFDWMIGRRKPPRREKRPKTEPTQVTDERTKAMKALLGRGRVEDGKPRRPPIFPK